MKRSYIAAGMLAAVITAAGPAHAGRYDAGDAAIVNKIERNGHRFYVPRYPYAGTATSATPLGHPFVDASRALGLSKLPSETGASSSAFAWRLVGATSDPMATLSAGGVTLEANRAAGCSIWGWTWNGKEFINHRDYGREMQISLSWVDSSHNTPNPTEAGDRYKNGSPCTATVSGDDLDTTSVPLEWNDGALKGTQGGPDRPVIWQDLTLGKQISLDYRHMGAVARFETDVTLPRALARGVIEIPTVYLGPEFDQLVTYDARSDQMLPARPPRNGSVEYRPRSGYGGVIATTAGHDYAMGLYGALTSSGGSASSFTAGGFVFPGGGGPGDTSTNTVKLGAKYTGPISQGRSTYTCWVISGTLAQVKQAMIALYRGSAGASARAGGRAGGVLKQLGRMGADRQ